MLYVLKRYKGNKHDVNRTSSFKYYIFHFIASVLTMLAVCDILLKVFQIEYIAQAEARASHLSVLLTGCDERMNVQAIT